MPGISMKLARGTLVIEENLKMFVQRIIQEILHFRLKEN